MQKIDFKKSLRHLYHASARAIVQIDVPAFRFLQVDGEGDPNTTKSYAEAVEALFAISYTAKFMLKKAPEPINYAVMPLEGLWWADEMCAFVENNRAKWRWTMMIMQPDFVTASTIEEAMAAVSKKKNLPGLDRVRLASFTEGLCAQILHIGPFSEEGATIERLHNFIDERTARRGKHHEIYLTDIRRAEPRKWKTILRQPMYAS